MRSSLHNIASILLLSGLFVGLSARDGGLIGAVSGNITTDGRPLLWCNRESPNRRVEIVYFKGPHYDFIGVCDIADTTRVWMGLNTAGFAIVYTPMSDLPGDSLDSEGRLIKKILGQCGTIQDFEITLRSSSNARASFACIDARSRCALFEVGEKTMTKFDIDNRLESDEGFRIRSHFSLTGVGVGSDAWRYHRARSLMRELKNKKNLSHESVLRYVARDVRSRDLDPYPLPFRGFCEGAPEGFVNTTGSINRNNTVACCVIHGVRDEAAALSTFWCIPGEPLCGVAIPFWPCCGEVPAELRGRRQAPLQSLYEKIRRRMYHDPRWPTFFDSETISLFTPQKVELDILIATMSEMNEWRRTSIDFHRIKTFQADQAKKVLHTLRF
jgi:hypothetical protein